jgi:hypothetical protein
MPGLLQIFRFDAPFVGAVCDVMFDSLQSPFSYTVDGELVQGSKEDLPSLIELYKLRCDELLVDVFDQGNLVYSIPSLPYVLMNVSKQLDLFRKQSKVHPIVLEGVLTKTKQGLMKK